MARVLLVEDDPQNSYLVRFMLEQAGHEVLIATDGEQAVTMADGERPDIVLMDMLLPIMSGYEATKRIRELPGLIGVPVIALTAYSMKGDVDKVLDAGCDAYICKPIDPDRFIGEVERFLHEG